MLMSTQLPAAATTSTSPEQLQAQRASVAVALAPLLVLLGFTAVVCGFIEPSTALALFAACTAWVVWEMSRYQDLVDTELDTWPNPADPLG